jgi:putative oxidoreductase
LHCTRRDFLAEMVGLARGFRFSR